MYNVQNYKKYLLLQKNSANFACEMKKIVIFVLLLLFLLHETWAQETFVINTQSPVFEPLHEMRSVWLTTNGGFDWPHTYSCSAYSAEKQKSELCDILDRLSAAGVNTVLFQTRIRATTIFPSEMEQWDGCLSGIPGKSPGYDALAFAIEQCHRRGMTLHAWIVAIPVGKWNKEGCAYLRKTNPSLLKKIGNEGFMNPEAAGTADYLARFCREVTRRYDIDGIHLDYIRYPETWKPIKDRDAARNNITRIVRAVHNAVKAEKPWVMMSCSPVGKYSDTKRQRSGGWNACDAVCQDAALWLQEGLMDALFPMMYFRGNNFYPFAIDWLERSSGKIVTPGLGIYFLDVKEKDWPLGDITQEMHVLRQYGMGYCFFRSKFFTDNTKGIYDYTANSFAGYPALQPAMTWYGKERPDAPNDVCVTAGNEGNLLLSWCHDSSFAVETDTLAGRILYNVYGSDHAPVDTESAENLLMAAYNGTSIAVPQSAGVKYFAVTATDRYGNESAACQSFRGKSANVKPLQYGSTMLPKDGNIVFLDKSDVEPEQLLEIRTLTGNVLTSCFAHIRNGRLSIDVAGMEAGHYVVYMINKKKYRHRVGIFSVDVGL